MLSGFSAPQTSTWSHSRDDSSAAWTTQPLPLQALTLLVPAAPIAKRHFLKDISAFYPNLIKMTSKKVVTDGLSHHYTTYPGRKFNRS